MLLRLLLPFVSHVLTAQMTSGCLLPAAYSLPPAGCWLLLLLSCCAVVRDRAHLHVQMRHVQALCCARSTRTIATPPMATLAMGALQLGLLPMATCATWRSCANPNPNPNQLGAPHGGALLTLPPPPTLTRREAAEAAKAAQSHIGPAAGSLPGRDGHGPPG